MSIRILGIDPGFGRVGIAIVDKEGGNISLIHSECFETSISLSHAERLAKISDRINEICQNYHPNEAAVETLLWSKNKKTALGVAEARGVILSNIASFGIEAKEINPNTVKISITGYGKSDKKQIIIMIPKIIKIEKIIKHDDEYDAIAIAIACAYNRLSPTNK